jgi:hypothetical protein
MALRVITARRTIGEWVQSGQACLAATSTELPTRCGGVWRSEVTSMTRQVDECDDSRSRRRNGKKSRVIRPGKSCLRSLLVWAFCVARRMRPVTSLGCGRIRWNVSKNTSNTQEEISGRMPNARSPCRRTAAVHVQPRTRRACGSLARPAPQTLAPACIALRRCLHKYRDCIRRKRRWQTPAMGPTKHPGDVAGSRAMALQPALLETASKLK